MSNDRQHRRTDRRYPTIKAIAIAKFDTHPPFPVLAIFLKFYQPQRRAGRPGISANKFMSFGGTPARNRTRRNGESLAWPVVPTRHLPRSRAGSSRVGRLLAKIYATLQRYTAHRAVK